LEQNAASVLREKTLSQDDTLTNLIICAVILGEGIQSLESQVQSSPPTSVIVPVSPEGHLNEWVTEYHKCL